MQHTRRDCKKKKGPICGKRLRRDKRPQKADIPTGKTQESDKKRRMLCPTYVVFHNQVWVLTT